MSIRSYVISAVARFSIEDTISIENTIHGRSDIVRLLVIKESNDLLPVVQSSGLSALHFKQNAHILDTNGRSAIFVLHVVNLITFQIYVKYN